MTDKAAIFLAWFIGTPVVSGVAWIALTFIVDFLDVEQQTQGRPVLMIGGMLTIPVVFVAAIVGFIVGTIVAFKSK